MDRVKLLINKGFKLNEYTEGKFWELKVNNNEKLKINICKAFDVDVELLVNGTDIDTLILQCAEDFTHCIFYYDCNLFNVDTNDFFECIKRI